MIKTWAGMLVLGLGGFAILGAANCRPSDPGKPEPVVTNQLFSREQLKLDQAPYAEGVLIMGGSAYAVSIDEKKGESGDFDLQINLEKERSTLEEEKYHITDSVFQYRGSSTETFEPPLTLINFPLKVPDTSDWNGTMKWGETTLEASAVITASSDPLNLQSGKVDDAVLILVKLSITESPGNIAEREFKFWVAPDRGVIRRDFAAASSREPAGSPPKEE